MLKLKLLMFAMRQASVMGHHMAGAELGGGDERRARAMAHKRLYFDALDALQNRPGTDRR